MASKIKVEVKDTAPLTERPWTRHYDPGVPATLIYPKVPLQAMLDDAAESNPNATATIFFNRKRTYKSISDAAWRLANGLRRLGVKKGDRVGLVLPNTPQFVIAFYGALRAGATVVPCNPRYTAPEMQHQLADSGATVVVKKDGHRQPFAGDPGAVAFRDVLAASADPFDVGTRTDDLALLQYTGGTTGISKGAMLSHRALVANTLQCRSWFTNLRDGQSTAMAVMPFFHVYGLTVVMSLAVQCAAAMVLEPQLDLEHLLKDVQRHRPQMFCGAPIIYNAINNSPLAKKYDLRSIEACISGSAPLLIDTHRKFVELTGAKLVEGYGLTEAAPVTHSNPLFGEGKQKVGTIGVPFPDVESKVVDLETGEREMPAGESGELIVRGPQLMDGYYRRPDETALTLRNGWLYTGDIATVDEEGYVAIVDRKKEMIIVSGFNVYPREVEEALITHPAVLDAAAIGVPHPIKGEEVKAFVVLKPGATVTADELRAHSAERLASFKRPHEIEFRQSLPKTLIGKTLRKELAAEERAKREITVPA